MNFIKVSVACFLFTIIGHAGYSKKTQAKEKYQANWESLKQNVNPDWFQDAKFGIYCHLGSYSVPAYKTEWYLHWM